ncbi:nuclear transport factor 2 family protein [Flavobacterium subsaxonicum]|uniref:nuclear transport factor 2 family protein n=1 Tax=Flavobacterium subsaxonicum TaxID=426226 RepID=UPI00041B296F|nr:ester cyclase [Flavobacterium subsaxonicum]
MKKQHLLLAFALCGIMAVSCKKTGPNEQSAANLAATDTTATAVPATEKNIAIVKASNEAFVKDDVAGVFKDYGDTFTEYGDTGEAHVYKSKDSLILNHKQWRAAFPDFKCTNEKYYANGDEVVVIADWTGTWRGDLMGQKATGKTLKFKDAEIYTVKNGKITAHSNIMPPKPIAESVGFVWPKAKK